jgi:hypothetical protein
MLSWNLNSQQPACVAQYHRILKAPTTQLQKLEILQWQTCHDCWSLGQDFNSGPLEYKAEVPCSWLWVLFCTHKSVFLSYSHPLQLPSSVWMRWLGVIHRACRNCLICQNVRTAAACAIVAEFFTSWLLMFVWLCFSSYWPLL